MIVYLDTSVLLRVLLAQDRAWKDWGRWSQCYSSSVFQIECRRALDRLRLTGALNDHDAAQKGHELRQLERVVSRVAISRSILDHAAMPMPTVVKTLDAIHLVTAVLLRHRRHPDLTFVTHDSQQARAARALAFDCIEA